MPNIRIQNLSKKYISGRREITALDGVDLDIENGKYHTLLGPSGCGKTTLLRTISGLTAPSSGEVFFDGKNVSGLPVQERDVGFVFQQFAVFPHLDVGDNTAYGPTVKGWTREEVEDAVETNLKLVGLLARRDAMPDQLSGGMRQRLGLARALATKSKLLLLDEPLSALDAKIGEFLRNELKRIVKKHNLTAIHVTHNQEEAMTISDNIILMKKGKIVQTGSPEQLYEHPKTVFCANFIGKCNFFIGEKEGEETIVHKGMQIHFRGKADGKRVVVGVRPEKIQLDTSGGDGRLHGKIELINFLGYLYEYVIDCEGEKVRAYKRIKEFTIKDKFKAGDEVYFWFHPEDTFVWPEPEDIRSEINPE